MKINALIALLFILSCQGYQLQTKKNPFQRYSVASVSVENFYNHSNLNNVVPSFTKEMVFMLSSFSDLRVNNNFKTSDAVLVGVISSAQSRRDSRVRSDDILSSSTIEERVDASKRIEYYIPTKTRLNLNLKVMLIQNYSKKDVELLKSNGELIGPRVLFTENIDLTEIYTREVLDGDTNNFSTTRAMGAEKNAVESMAKSAANTLKEMMLYAF